ncbi:MAG: class A beta-lactamase [Rhodobacteraceae bacterium]|nr:class A beta-lactamase [Paracoccaceae bacterium]
MTQLPVKKRFRIGLLNFLVALSWSLFAIPVSAQPAEEAALAASIRSLELQLNARIGVQITDGKSAWQWGYRSDEQFLMASTFKPLLCGAVLDQTDQGQLSLAERVPVQQSDLLDYAPVTRNYVGQSLSIAELCQAAIDLSDNTAANLLLNRIGGPRAVTSFLRQIGDQTTRLDRTEPELNRFVPGDIRDTTTPAAMLETWEKLLLGNSLTPAARQLLTKWMETGSVTGQLLRPHLPKTWKIADKSGGGRHHTRNIVAMISPNGHSTYFVAIFVSDTSASWSDRNSAVSQISRAVVELLKARL